MDAQILVILYLTVLRHMVLTYSPTIVFSGYAYMFAISFAISYSTLRDLKASLTISLLAVIGQVAYRYRQNEDDLKNTTGLGNTIMFVFGLATVFVASNLLGPYKDSLIVDYTLYAVVMYSTASVIEWIIHRYLMHCYQYAPWILNIPNVFIKGACLEHKNHHLSVKGDMTLRETSHDEELIFDLKTTSIFTVIIFIMSGFVVYSLDIKGVTVYTHAIVSVLGTLLVSMIWNSIHTKMHKNDIDISVIPESVYNVYLKNHNLHHQIKGEDKGNFNVVVLGADEIFKTNNKEK
jgi:hypothetical protein